MTKCILTGLLVGGMSLSHAQQNNLSSGGEATGSGGTVSYSVGQIDYSNFNATDGNVNQGVQQPYEFYGDASLTEGGLTILSLFPNPTTDKIIIKTPEFSDDLRYQLVDMHGKIVVHGGLHSEETNVAMEQLSTGAYHLNIYRNQEQIETFKIIKH